MKILELRYGSAPAEPENIALPVTADDVASMSWNELRVLAASLVTVTPDNNAVGIQATATEPAT